MTRKLIGTLLILIPLAVFLPGAAACAIHLPTRPVVIINFVTGYVYSTALRRGIELLAREP